MPPELALVESRSLRASLTHRVGILDKVKILVMLPDGTYVTTKMVATYFEVDPETIKKVVQRHRAELESNGMTVLRGSALISYDREVMSLSNEGYPQLRSNLTSPCSPARAVLNVAMVLRDSLVAKQVRRHLLDIEEQVVHRSDHVLQPRAYRPSPGRQLGPGPHWDECEKTSRNPELEAWRRVVDGEVDRDVTDRDVSVSGENTLPPGWPDSVDRRLDSMGRVTGAMSHKLNEVGHEVRRMRKDLNALRRDIHTADRHR